MSALAALALALSAARVESIAVTQFAGAPAVRLAISADPVDVSLERDGDVARVRLRGARLGLAFAGQRFSWLPQPPAARAARSESSLARLDVIAGESDVSVDLTVPAATRLEVRRAGGSLWLVLHPPPAPPRGPVAFAAIARREPPEAQPQAPARDDVAGLARALFPDKPTPAKASESEAEAVADLYPRLFPAGSPEAAPEAEAESVDVPAAGVPLGPFRLRGSLAARYVDADTFLAVTPTRDRYLEVGPKLAAEAPVARGRFTLDYTPVFRALATYHQVNSTSELAGAALELPVGDALTFRAAERFASGTLDTRLVDPGGEYFYDLGRFHRNDVEAGAGVALGPRLTLELSGKAGRVRFAEPSGFFDYDSRTASAGLGFELAPGLKSSLFYSYDAIPRSAERPQAEAQAHSVRVTLDGGLLPLLSGQLALGYRGQSNPAAGAGGRRFSGLTASGVLTQRLGHESQVSFYVSRSTPPSAFEANGFYVANALQASAELPLPLALQLRGGLGWQWNSYRTVASALGRPRHDRLLDWYVALRRPLRRHLTLGGSYRSASRDSNVNGLDSDSSGFVLQLEWEPFEGNAR